MAEPARAPNRSPPGNLSHSITSASAVDTPTSTANSASEPASTATRADGGALAANPNSASAAGSPTSTTSTRVVCTIATPRMLALKSAASVIACAKAPGLAPRNAESGSKPCTNRR